RAVSATRSCSCTRDVCSSARLSIGSSSSRLRASGAISGRRIAMVITRRLLLGAILLCVGLGAPSQERFITVASTTSTEQSGLFGYLLPIYEKETGIRVRVVALGTGQALDVGRRGDADVVFVHAREAEQKFLAEG